jgi:hypothetical protein
MQDMLAPLGVYSLEDNSLVMCELKTYALELERLHEALRTMLHECFISTAQSYGIDKIEELFERFRPDLTLDERRERISRYMTLNNTDSSTGSIEGQLRLAGVFARFDQNAEDALLSFPELIAMSDISEKASALNIIEDIVPAHLGIDVGICAMSWDSLDNLNLNFNQLDRLGLRLDLLDE